jgi:hypothetical protein
VGTGRIGSEVRFGSGRAEDPLRSENASEISTRLDEIATMFTGFAAIERYFRQGKWSHRRAPLSVNTANTLLRIPKRRARAPIDRLAFVSVSICNVTGNETLINKALSH